MPPHNLSTLRNSAELSNSGDGQSFLNEPASGDYVIAGQIGELAAL